MLLEELYLRVFTAYCDNLVAFAVQSLEDKRISSPRQRLETFLMGLAKAFGSESPRRGCFLSPAVGDLAAPMRRSPALPAPPSRRLPPLWRKPSERLRQLAR